MSFELQCGINISHWLSQSPLRGKERTTKFSKEDVSRISDAGFDHVRLPVDEVQMWNENGTIDTLSFDILNESIYWCKQQGIRSIIDMHILHSHYFNDATEPKLYTEISELDHFCRLWEDLSKQVREWSNDTIAYEILNEPKAENSQDWNRVSGTVIKMLREIEKERTVILGSNWYCKADTFDTLDIPDDSNMLLTFHFYDPMLVTHHKAYWTNIGKYTGPINYPGQPVSEEEIGKIPEPLKSSVVHENSFFNRDTIIERLQKPLEVRKKTGKQIFCGEFGCINNTPHELRCGWYKDIISVFSEFKIPYTHWDYKGVFGIFNEDGSSGDVVDILQKKAL